MPRNKQHGQFNGAMEEVSMKIQKASTHAAGLIVVDVAVGKCHSRA